jgi:hypothetical protein
MRLEFHPAVQQDLTDALDYYRNEGAPHLSERFEKEFRACLTAIKAARPDLLFILGAKRFAGSDFRIFLI